MKRPYQQIHIPLDRMISDIFHTYCLAIIIHRIVYGFFRCPNNGKEQSAGLTGQQLMLTPPWHLFIPLSFVEVRVFYDPVLFIFFEILILNTVCVHHISLYTLSWIPIAAVGQLELLPMLLS